MQPKKGTRSGQLKSRLKQLILSQSEQAPSLKRMVVGTHEKRGRLAEAAPARFSSPQTKGVELNLEDKVDDFGDPPTLYSSLESMEIGMPRSDVSLKKSSLDLKPTSKKLAQTLLLAEILTEPRAKRPHQLLGYKKR